MSEWVAGAGLSASEGSPGVSGLRPPTLASIHLTNIDGRFTGWRVSLLRVRDFGIEVGNEAHRDTSQKDTYAGARPATE